MKRFICVLSALVLAMSVSFAQKNDRKGKSSMPQTHTQVNKEFDKNGNLIRYDSVYSYQYSSTNNVEIDSFLRHFNTAFPMSRNLAFGKDLFPQEEMESDFFADLFADEYKAESLFFGSKYYEELFRRYMQYAERAKQKQFEGKSL